MAFIIIEGVDRVGKSSVAEYYKKQGYIVHHMSAPNKKYSSPGYTGPSYLDELLDLYMSYSGKNVIFDRSGYGELVWSIVYGRKAQLSEEDIEILIDYENANDTQRILMHDPNMEAHWQRCVANNEPLTRSQFDTANKIFDRVATKYGFEKKQLSEVVTNYVAPVLTPEQQKAQNDALKNTVTITQNNVTMNIEGSTISGVVNSGNLSNNENKKTKQQIKLEKANAINEILSSKILKKKGEYFDSIESDIRDFLNNKLSDIFGSGTNTSEAFNKEEIQILKTYAQRIKEKMGAK